MGGKDIASFNRLATPMVGSLAKDLSTRGGAVALQFAQGGKYDPSQPYEYNQGILEANNDAIVRDYNRNAAEYRNRHGKEPPYKLPKYYRDWEKKREQQQQSDLQGGEQEDVNNKTPVTKWIMKDGKLEKA